MADNALQQAIVRDVRYLDSFKGVTIYGVAGTNGSGKDSLMDLLVERGFFCFNTSHSLRQISHAVFQSTDRGGNDSSMGRVGNAIRAAYPGGPVELGLLSWWLLCSVLPKELQPKGLVIGSIRAVGEAERLKQVGGKLIGVDADAHVRFERLSARGRADDNDTFEQFMEKETAEMAAAETDPTKFGMAAVIAMADIRIQNNGNDIEAFKASAAQALGL
jgi:dephospho-CoA kinase